MQISTPGMGFQPKTPVLKRTKKLKLPIDAIPKMLITAYFRKKNSYVGIFSYLFHPLFSYYTRLV
jgi:hypothetical protein